MEKNGLAAGKAAKEAAASCEKVRVLSGLGGSQTNCTWKHTIYLCAREISICCEIEFLVVMPWVGMRELGNVMRRWVNCIVGPSQQLTTRTIQEMKTTCM